MDRDKGSTATYREVECLKLLLMGMSNDQIAQAMNLASGEVAANFVSKLLAKYAADTRTELALIAVRRLPMSKRERVKIRQAAIDSGEYHNKTTKYVREANVVLPGKTD